MHASESVQPGPAEAIPRIAEKGDVDAITAVAARLEHADRNVRAAAVNTLGKIADKGNADAIAAVVIGGTSLSGGRGTVLGTLIGALIMSVLLNGLRILSVAQEWQTVVTGSIIILAVYIDMLRRRKL